MATNNAIANGLYLKNIIMPMSYELYLAFSKRLTELCDGKNMPERGRQAELARVCGIKPSSVNKWFKAMSLPDAVHLLKIAEWGNTTTDWLLSGRNAHYSNNQKQIEHMAALMQHLSPFEADKIVKITDTITEHTDPKQGNGR